MHGVDSTRVRYVLHLSEMDVIGFLARPRVFTTALRRRGGGAYVIYPAHGRITTLSWRASQRLHAIGSRESKLIISPPLRDVGHPTTCSMSLER